MGNGLLVSHIALLFHSVEGSGKKLQICRTQAFLPWYNLRYELRTAHSND